MIGHYFIFRNKLTDTSKKKYIIFSVDTQIPFFLNTIVGEKAIVNTNTCCQNPNDDIILYNRM